jgi:hypothetical protein
VVVGGGIKKKKTTRCQENTFGMPAIKLHVK